MKELRTPNEEMNQHHEHNIFSHQPHHDHFPQHIHGHMPPHICSSKIQLDYNENIIAAISELYGEKNVNNIIRYIETSPPEMKLTSAMSLSINVDLSKYPQEALRTGRFSQPFFTEENAVIITQALQCNNIKAVMNIYNNCPPEQAILALAVAKLKLSKENNVQQG